MDITDGNGVDVILNSLTGNLLDESWRCISDGGTMIEIGKKDVLARNNLSMEPFNRNATYRGVDMSHMQISDPLIASYVFFHNTHASEEDVLIVRVDCCLNLWIWLRRDMLNRSHR